MVARVMKCTSPDDPAVQDVIRNEEDLQLAMFISKALAKAILHHTAPNSSLNQPSTSEYARPPRPIAPPSRISREDISPPMSQYHHGLAAAPTASTATTTSNFQQRGLTGLREPLLNYEPRQRRRSGEHFNNSWIEPPFKLCKASSSFNHFR